MKKLVFFLISLLFAVVSIGQTKLDVKSLRTSVDAVVDVSGTNNDSYIWFYGSETADTIIASETWSYTVVLVKDYSADLKYEARVELDSISGSPAVSMILKGKYSWNDSWVPLDTVVWAGTTADTTMVITYDTAKNYRFAGVFLVADGTTQKSQVERVEFGVYD